MSIHAGVVKRQLWELPTQTSASWEKHCTPFTLPSNGVLSLADSIITLTTDVVFQPECTGGPPQDVSSIADLKEPFYASTIPQTFVIAAATVIAWILVIMLIITPRTSFLGYSGAASGFASGHGLIGGATGGRTSLIGVGSRPWLQKVAALTVAISLAIATADTFVEAEHQYVMGYMDATSLRNVVLGSTEIKVSRVVSDVFLWLAQVQTLIRLFPRHKEKVLIKWIGFALILLDSLFSCLNSFMIHTKTQRQAQHQPRQFVDAIPALSYLFELALGLLYAAWVMYYSLTKRRYAYYHKKMRSIVLIAILSIVAILTPVVFFVTDVSNPDVAGWGDYFRWVGAAAAAVIVWEWVERIEALEADENKDGILGRELFDGDEMLDVMPNDEVVYNDKRGGLRRGGRDDDESGGDTIRSSALEAGSGGLGLGSVGRRLRGKHYKPRKRRPSNKEGSENTETTDFAQPVINRTRISFGELPRPRNRDRDNVLDRPAPPLPVASPVDRMDTTSAASTVYVVHYHPTTDIPQPVRRRVDASGNTAQAVAQHSEQQRRRSVQEARNSSVRDHEKENQDEDVPTARERRPNNWLTVANPFKRKRASPPAEVQQARRTTLDEARPNIDRAATPAHNFSRWDVANRAGVLAAQVGERWHDRPARRKPQVDLPVTIIPAQPRGSGRTWSPQQQSQEQPSQESARQDGNEGSTEQGESSGSTTLTSNSNPSPTASRQVDAPNRADEVRSHAAEAPATTAVPTTPVQATSPPRASDLSSSPAAGTTVIPAPRRSTRSSPLATHHASASSADGARTSDREDTRDAG